MISIIAAVSSNGIIGVNNKLPFSYSEDLKHFKEKTINSTIIMGRKTFDSIGRPLPKRSNFIISSQSFEINDCTIFSNIKEAIQAGGDNIWLIGGASIYQEGMTFADQIILTVTPDIILEEPNVKFPWINPLHFKIKKITNLTKILKIVIYEKY